MKTLEILSGSICKDPNERSCIGYENAFWNDQKCPLKIKGNTLKKSEWRYFISLDGVFHFVPKGTKCFLKAQMKDKKLNWIEAEEELEITPKHDLLVVVSNNEVHAIVPLFSTKEEADRFQKELQKKKDNYGYLNIMIEISKWYHQ